MNMGKTVLSISKIRGWLYLVARLLGDVSAVRKGAVGKRVARRVTGKASGRILRKLIGYTNLQKESLMHPVPESD